MDMKLIRDAKIERLKLAAAELGFDLVERLPGITDETANHIIEACEAADLELVPRLEGKDMRAP